MVPVALLDGRELPEEHPSSDAVNAVAPKHALKKQSAA
jgi:hypothetical protein